MLKSILVFFDGSTESRKAFDLGLDMAITYQAKMLIISVMPTVEAEAVLEGKQDYPVEELHGLCLAARNKGVQCQYRTDIGELSKQVLRAAKDHTADMIIMGQRQDLQQQARIKTPLEAILSYAQCPVTIIK